MSAYSSSIFINSLQFLVIWFQSKLTGWDPYLLQLFIIINIFHCLYCENLRMFYIERHSQEKYVQLFLIIKKNFICTFSIILVMEDTKANTVEWLFYFRSFTKLETSWKFVVKLDCLHFVEGNYAQLWSTHICGSLNSKIKVLIIVDGHVPLIWVNNNLFLMIHSISHRFLI